MAYLLYPKTAIMSKARKQKSTTMTTVIKNIHLLSLPDKDRAKLEHGAALHKRMSNIQFKILEVTPSGIVIRVLQSRHLSDNYANKEILVTRTRELFEPFLSGKKIHPQAIEPGR